MNFPLGFVSPKVPIARNVIGVIGALLFASVMFPALSILVSKFGEGVFDFLPALVLAFAYVHMFGIFLSIPVALVLWPVISIAVSYRFGGFLSLVILPLCLACATSLFFSDLASTGVLFNVFLVLALFSPYTVLAWATFWALIISSPEISE